MHTTRKIGAVVAALFMAAALWLPVFAIADSTSVTVTFRVSPTVSAEIVDDGLLIQSNAPWQLTGTMRDVDGVATIHESGGATGATGSIVHLEDLVDYTLVLDPAR